MPTLANQRVRTHLQARIVIQTPTGPANIGSGRVQSFDADHDYGTQAVHGVGDYIPVEFVNLKFQGTLTIDAFALNTNDMVDLGLAALDADILKLGLLDIELHSDNTGADGSTPYDPNSQGGTIRVYHDVAITRYRESIREGQICGENATAFFRYSTKEGIKTSQGATNNSNPAAATAAAAA